MPIYNNNAAALHRVFLYSIIIMIMETKDYQGAEYNK